MKNYPIVLLLSLLLFSCASSEVEQEKLHPLIGRWQLAQVNDSVVIENPYVIGMEFTNDGRIIQRDGAAVYEAKYMISDDTTTISILEGGKVVEEFKLRSLSDKRMVIEEGYDGITFLKLN